MSLRNRTTTKPISLSNMKKVVTKMHDEMLIIMNDCTADPLNKKIFLVAQVEEIHCRLNRLAITIEHFKKFKYPGK